MKAKFYSEFVTWAIRISLTAALTGILAIGAWILTPIGSRLTLIWDSPAVLTRIENKVDGAIRDIAALQRPSEIFDLSVANSGPIEGFCVELEPCDIRLKVRRRPETVDCRVIAGSAEWTFLNTRNDTESQARRLDTPQGQNIGVTWTFIDVQIMTPSGLSPTAEFFFRVSYTNCAGPTDTAIIEDPSAHIPVTIYNTREDAERGQ